MKKYLIAAASTLAFASAANAQTGTAGPFTGPYVGIQTSLGQIDDYTTDLDYWYTGNTSHTDDRGALIGLRAGYDIQSGSLLAGALIEGSFGKVNDIKEVGTSGDLLFRVGTRVKKIGSARAKLGLTSGTLAAFVTGGIAMSDARQVYRETDGSGELYTANGDRSGYVLGLGAAYAINANSTLGLDYSHYEFGSRVHKLYETDGTYTNSDFRQDYKVRALTLSFNYGF
ncbi:MAG: outer membrane beta-barrel protein [Sphingomicrobium sp.]